jgi:hypothetical protein
LIPFRRLARRTPGRLVWLTLVGAFVAFSLAACSKDESPPHGAGTAPIASVDVSAYHQRLGEELWANVREAGWLKGELATPDGARLLEVVAGAGPLVSQERKRTLLQAYPDGLDEERLSVARQYARWTIADLPDVIDSAWLLDGINDYERAVLAAATERTISPTALKLAMEQRFFADLFESNPELLTSRRIDALGSLNPQILARAEQESWFKDGLDDYDISLLGILADVIQVDDAIDILDRHAYRPLRVGDTTIAVVLTGDSDRLEQKGLDLVQKWIQPVADFVGEFESIGLIIDVTPIPGDPFCHGDGGNEYSVGFIAFTSDGCFYDQVAIHELAHAFIGGRYPAWFTEGIAELVTTDISGAPAGYTGGRGLIEPDGYYFVGSSAYVNQASLGTGFLVDLYDLAGPMAMSAFTHEIAGQRLGGANLLARIRDIAGVSKAKLEELISTYFGNLPPVASGAPAATPQPAGR